MTEKENPILILLDEHRKQTNRYWTLDSDSVIIGRDDASADIALGERQISRQHVRIYRDGKQYFVEDLESRNGTWVNGERLKGVRELFDSDEIHIAMAVRVQFIGSGATAPMPEVPEGVMGKLRLDHEARRVFVGETEVDPPLSVPQYRLLELLFGNAGRICTRDMVVNSVWPEAMGEGVSEQAIDALVRRLRDRLAEIDPDWQYIVTVRGHGFRLDNQSDA